MLKGILWPNLRKHWNVEDGFVILGFFLTINYFCCHTGHDFCSEGHNCMEHSVCRNLEDRAVCSCRDGFRTLREDNAYCEGNPF